MAVSGAEIASWLLQTAAAAGVATTGLRYNAPRKTDDLHMIKAALAFCSVLLCMSCAYAQQPSFPFLQDGGARESFVNGANNFCVKTQTAAAETRIFRKIKSQNFAFATREL